MEYTHGQKMTILFQKVVQVLIPYADARVPETGSFRRVGVNAEIPEEGWESILSIEQSYRSETERHVTLGVHRINNHTLVSNYLHKGTKQEILAWLASPDGLVQIIASCDHLIEKIKNSD